MRPEEIISLRHRTGLNQEQFARLMGVRQATISYWETGRHAPREVQLAMLEQLRLQFADSDHQQANRERLEAALKVGLIGVLGLLFGAWRTDD
jgi:transcriptional regulator with XRE-family HTH domain